MNTFRMRLLVLLTPKCLFWLLVIGGGGFFLITVFGESQVAKIDFETPYLKPLEAVFKEQLSGRYSSIAFGWVATTVAFLWNYIGRQLKRADRLF